MEELRWSVGGAGSEPATKSAKSRAGGRAEGDADADRGKKPKDAAAKKPSARPQRKSA
jgi:DNA end-binding protein Ku